MLRNLMAKYAEIEKNECLVEEQFTDDADIVIAAYGTTARICRHRRASGARQRASSAGLSAR